METRGGKQERDPPWARKVDGIKQVATPKLNLGISSIPFTGGH